MNIHEGARRMQRAEQWMVMIVLSVLVLLVLAGAVMTSFHSGTLFPWSLIPEFIPLLLLGVLLWIAGWIVDGFGRDAQKSIH